MQFIQFSIACAVSVCQSASGSGPQCGFNPTLPWPGSKDNEVPEVGTLQMGRGVTSQAGLWSAPKTHGSRRKKTTGNITWRQTLYSPTVESQLGIFTLLRLIQGNNTGWEHRTCFWCKSTAKVFTVLFHVRTNDSAAMLNLKHYLEIDEDNPTAGESTSPLTRIN